MATKLGSTVQWRGRKLTVEGVRRAHGVTVEVMLQTLAMGNAASSASTADCGFSFWGWHWVPVADLDIPSRLDPTPRVHA